MRRGGAPSWRQTSRCGHEGVELCAVSKRLGMICRQVPETMPQYERERSGRRPGLAHATGTSENVDVATHCMSLLPCPQLAASRA